MADIKPFVVQTTYGMTIMHGRSLECVKRKAIKENGTNNFVSIREAEEKDIQWFRMMGGVK